MTTIIRQMRRKEFDTLVEWAADEGWNPGLADADIFWETDPDAFIALERDGKLIGGGSIVSYNGQYGFMGFFIVHPELRGQGLGGTLWHERVRLLSERLDPEATIGMDGVFDLQPFYERGGFRFVARDIRFESTGTTAKPSIDTLDATTLSIDKLVEFDARYFPTPRPQFIVPWIQRTGGSARAIVEKDLIRGYGVIRPCRFGHKIGPLFAESPEIASNLFLALSSTVPGELVYLDVPEDNPSAMTLASEHNMTEVFGCARLFRGSVPEIPIGDVYGVTTFELG